ncbi:MAG: class I SAM-dependent methyltransferase [Ruminiclostridium sp.]
MPEDAAVRAEKIMRLTGLYGETNRAAIENRLRLIDFWKIESGSRILEVGCGQGETTAALAYTVGDRGFIYGIDVAGPDYGSPETVGQARERLMTSGLGERINIDLGVNILSDSFDFEDNSFDYIILSHCLWYLSSQKELHDILFKTRRWGLNLCIAEWNPAITEMSQYSHFSAAEIQAICEAYPCSDHFNIHTMFYPQEIETAAAACGWDIVKTADITCPDNTDAVREIEIARELFPQKISALKAMPQKLKSLLLSRIYTLSAENAASMSVYAMRAERL